MKKQILTGEESFEKIIEGNFFYIDKTFFIKEFLENRGTVTLITRPRRFGKTLNMNMLDHFFDINKDSKTLFDGLKIMEHKDLVETHLNKYPVVSLTLKNVEEDTYKESIENIRDLVSEIYQKNEYLCENNNLNEFKKTQFYRHCSKESTDVELKSALKFLTSCLYTYHKKRVIVLLDEYDTPIDNSVQNGFYKKMINFMRGFLGRVFKTNDYLEFGVLTGVQRISKESLISSFNNPLVCGIMDKDFTTCFGFTETEVKETCAIYEISDKYDEIKNRYDGYRFGGQDMYNPWSIVRYVKTQEPDNYWINTGSLHILQEVFYKGDNELRNDFAGLITGKPITMSLEDGITYPIKYVNSNTFWTLLLNAGYLKPCNGAKTGKFGAELVNMEIISMFSRYAIEWFSRQKSATPKIIQEFVHLLLIGDKEGVSNILNDDLLNNPSCHDFKKENCYHLFIYGILLAASDDYIVYSNPESGKGRSDCLLKPFDKEKNAVAIEFKHCGDKPATSTKKITEILKEEAQKGLIQIDEKAYIHNLKKEGYNKILKYGIAFYKKKCEVAMTMVNECIEVEFCETK
ncbi:MAG: ATP-binding protein [Marinilabiliaceae bacterium]|nr:ATP-binding protein [Marinilabiliaceae bacterium]